MKLADKIISSLTAFRASFDFYEAWNKRDMIVRDMSPTFIYYDKNEDKDYYKAIKSPELYLYRDGVIMSEEIVFDQLTDKEQNLLKGVPEKEVIQAIGLIRLAKSTLPYDIQDLFSANYLGDKGEVFLPHGASLKLYPIEINGSPLKSKQIKASSKTAIASIVGNLRLLPGEATYGVFQGEKLISVCPKEAQNDKYRLTYTIENNNVILLVVDRSSGNVVKYSNVYCFALIGDDNFVVVDGLTVRSFDNVDLNNRLRYLVKKSKLPVFVKYNNDKQFLSIMYSTGEMQEIQL